MRSSRRGWCHFGDRRGREKTRDTKSEKTRDTKREKTRNTKEVPVGLGSQTSHTRPS